MAIVGHGLRLVERGRPAIIAEEDWEESALEEAIQPLLERGILGVQIDGGFRIVEPRQFVGTLRLPGRSITIAPRRPKLFADLTSLVRASPAKRVVAADEAESSEKRSEVDVVGLFVRALDEAFQVGLPFSYVRMPRETTSPRGRLLTAQTIRKFAVRGINHKAVCVTSERRYPAGLMTVIATAGATAASRLDLPPKLGQRLGDLLDLLAGAGERIPAREAIGLAEEQRALFEGWPEVLRLLRSSTAILQADQAIWDFERPMPGGECRFCDTDRLWELAVHSALQDSVRAREHWRADYHPLANSGMLLLRTGGPAIDPDILLLRSELAPVVVDAKQSEATGASAADIYQVVCYVRRLSAALGALVYLTSGGSWSVDIGTTPEGALIVAMGVNMERVWVDLPAAAAGLVRRL